jgi:hypothetical protein
MRTTVVVIRATNVNSPSSKGKGDGSKGVMPLTRFQFATIQSVAKTKIPTR